MKTTSHGMTRICALLCAIVLLTAGTPSDRLRRDPHQAQQELVIYEVFPRAFSASGRIEEVTNRLDELQRLGVDVIYLMPLHPVGQVKRKGTYGSPYAVVDYLSIDPAVGTKQDLDTLVDAAHRLGMRVIMDLVANHTAWDSVLMADPGFYTRDANGSIVSPMPEWGDVADLNYDNPKVRTYMLDVMRYWVIEHDIDGYRIDSAGLVPPDFWRAAREALTLIKPDVLLLGEWYDPAIYEAGFGAGYALPVSGAVLQVVEEGSRAERVAAAWTQEQAQFPRHVIPLRFLDHHDMPRAMVRFGAQRLKMASVLLFLLPGHALLYNGMEVADVAQSNGEYLFGRHLINWNTEQSALMRRFYSQLIDIKDLGSSMKPDVAWISMPDAADVVAFYRGDSASGIFVAVNVSSRAVQTKLVLPHNRRYVEITPDLGAANSRWSQGQLWLGPYGWIVFRAVE